MHMPEDFADHYRGGQVEIHNLHGSYRGQVLNIRLDGRRLAVDFAYVCDRHDGYGHVPGENRPFEIDLGENEYVGNPLPQDKFGMACVAKKEWVIFYPPDHPTFVPETGGMKIRTALGFVAASVDEGFVTRYTGGQVEINGSVRRRGQIKSLRVEDDKLAIEFEYLCELVKFQGYRPCENVPHEVSLLVYHGCDLGSGEFVLNSPLTADSLTFYPPDHHRRLLADGRVWRKGEG